MSSAAAGDGVTLVADTTVMAGEAEGVSCPTEPNSPLRAPPLAAVLNVVQPRERRGGGFDTERYQESRVGGE